jgi:hypothetical protein
VIRDRAVRPNRHSNSCPEVYGFVEVIQESGKNMEQVKRGPPKIIHRCSVFKKIKTCCTV